MDFINSFNVPKLKKSQAKIIVIGVVALSVLFVVIFLISRIFLGEGNSIVERISDNNKETNSAEVFILNGGPRIQISESINKTVEEGGDLSIGDVITNDRSSRAIIVFSDNSYILLDNNSSFEILEDNKFLIDGRAFARSQRDNEYIITDGEIDFKLNNSRGSFTSFENSREIINFLGNSVLSNGENEIVFEDEQKVEFENASEISDSLVTLYSTDDEDLPYWDRYFSCTDSKISLELTDGRSDRDNSLKSRLDNIKSCDSEIEEEIFAELEQQNREEYLDQKQKEDEREEEDKELAEITSIQDNGAFTDVDTISCIWTAVGDEISGYEYSVGTSAGSVDIVDWTDTSQNSFEESSLGFTEGQKYYCNVRALSPNGNSSVKSSDGIIYDPSTATVDITSFPTGQVEGTVTYSNIPDGSNLIITIYVKNSEGQYFDGTEWGDTIVWHETTTVDSNPVLTWTTSTNFTGVPEDYSGGTIFTQVKNNLSGKIINQVTTPIP